jgi:hypothetical protein
MAAGPATTTRLRSLKNAHTMAVQGNVVSIKSIHNAVLAVVSLKDGDYVNLEVDTVEAT